MHERKVRHFVKVAGPRHQRKCIRRSCCQKECNWYLQWSALTLHTLRGVKAVSGTRFAPPYVASRRGTEVRVLGPAQPRGHAAGDHGHGGADAERVLGPRRHGHVAEGACSYDAVRIYRCSGFNVWAVQIYLTSSLPVYFRDSLHELFRIQDSFGQEPALCACSGSARRRAP